MHPSYSRSGRPNRKRPDPSPFLTHMMGIAILLSFFSFGALASLNLVRDGGPELASINQGVRAAVPSSVDGSLLEGRVVEVGDRLLDGTLNPLPDHAQAVLWGELAVNDLLLDFLHHRRDVIASRVHGASQIRTLGHSPIGGAELMDAGNQCHVGRGAPIVGASFDAGLMDANGHERLAQLDHALSETLIAEVPNSDLRSLGLRHVSRLPEHPGHTKIASNRGRSDHSRSFRGPSYPPPELRMRWTPTPRLQLGHPSHANYH